MSEHAKLSASASERWLNCTLAPTLEAEFADERSSFAEEGTRAHELGQKSLENGCDTDKVIGDYPDEMRTYVQDYVDYVRAIPGQLFVEQRLSMETWVPEGFGTTDTVVIREGHMTVVDLKYGKGKRVDAERNPQLMLYGLAAYDAYNAIYGPIVSVKLVVYQPRLDHIDEWEISIDDLLAWGDEIRPIAAAAFVGEGEAKAGDWCQFCRARHTCRARAEINLSIARTEMGAWLPEANTLTEKELADIYPKLDGMVRWANDLQGYMLGKAEDGVKFAGLKLVAGRSTRSWIDAAAAQSRFKELGFTVDDYMTAKVIGITDAEQLVGKKEFAERFKDVVQKPPGKPVLVPASDKREELMLHRDAVAEMSSNSTD